MAADVTSRRALIGRAALDVLAAEGLRGLTHRAVDAAAGLSAGSVNYYVRSRDELLTAALDELFSQDVTATTAALARSRLARQPLTVDITARGLAELIGDLAGPPPHTRVLARHELLCEAQRRPEFKERFEQQRRVFVQFATGLLAELGCPSPARRADTLVALIDGLTLRQTMLGGRSLPLTEITRTLRAFIAESCPAR